MINQYAYHTCMQYMHRYVRVQLKDGNVYDGFIANVDQQNLTLALPARDDMGDDSRQFFGTFGGFFPGPRFSPFAFPLASIGGLFPLGFFI